MGLSTHVLDTFLGRPAGGIPVILYQEENKVWVEIGSGITDKDGRCGTLLAEQALEISTYRVRFDTGMYFEQQATLSLYPFVEVVFTVREPDQHYHIPLLLSPNGYTTYRGS